MKWNFALAACCLLLLGMNVALLRQNRTLRNQLAVPPPASEVPLGTQVPDLAGFDVSGRHISVAYGQNQPKVLLFVFSPSCQFCAQNWPKWWQLFPSIDRSNVRPVGVDVSSTATPDYINEHRLNEMPVLTQLDPKDTVGYHLRLTPQTILVDGNGRVEKVWSGVLDDNNVAEIERMAGKSMAASVR